MKPTNPWGNPVEAKILVIGHDPRLQRGDTIAETCFFADYFEKPMPTKGSEIAKYKLAENLFGYIAYLTSYRFTFRQFFITNLCNKPLHHAPKGKTVLIPEKEAAAGVQEIQEFIRQGNFHLIFAMSQQVNYWLQQLHFCEPHQKFLEYSRPVQRGMISDPRYYQPQRSSAFQMICGEKLNTEPGIPLFPILHVKNWPLKGRFIGKYEGNYRKCVDTIKRITTA